MASKSDIVAEARKWLGTPYHHQGRVLGHGVDCLGLVAEVAKALDLCHTDRNDYGRMPEGTRLLDELTEHAGRRMRYEHSEPGDILVFRFMSHPRHVGIRTDVGVIHSYAQLGKVVEHSLDARWIRQIVCAFEFPGVTCN